MSNGTFSNPWDHHYAALVQYAERTGTTKAGTKHRETLEGIEVPLSAWSATQRRNEKLGLLPEARRDLLSAIPGWDWGPMRPGPPQSPLNKEICRLREEGLTMTEIGKRYGISRQRVYQITMKSGWSV
jgi:hypothetical protein